VAEIELGPADAGATRAVSEGDELIVGLDETPTSGYRWAVDAIDPSVLEVVGDEFTPPAPGPLGGSGRHEFRFRVIGTGSSPIRLVLARAWDPTAAADTYETAVDASASPGTTDGPE
jgi:predicted secreted protein